jgi:hypothetical protein
MSASFSAGGGGRAVRMDESGGGRSVGVRVLAQATLEAYLLNPAEWLIVHLALRESPDTHRFLVALPFQ